ncbi:hypothetical protein DVH05_009156 [Phytophthora capsici]|nr:hypothetical protein DVH05_009156 [Phytophthora capsici]
MQEAKRQRMDGAQKEAKQLVQGTLMPVFTLNDVTRVLKSSYSYESAYDFLKNVPVKEVGPRKQAIAREVNSSECMKSVQFVFTPEFSRKCSRAVEDFKKTTGQNKETTEKQTAVGIAVMIDYYRAMDKLAVVAETVEWIKTTSLNRLHVPEGLDEFVNLDKTKAATAIQRLVLPMSRQSPFGRIANESLLLFRKNLWLNDDSIMHTMTTLSEEMNELGVISPGFNATRDMSTTGNVIAGSEPFAKKNKFALLPICIHGNHWCGAVFNFVDEPNSITLYDPQQ